jgi:rhodanese-related sulfurtransferase
MEDVLIDVREFPEFASGHIAGAKPAPLGTLERASADWDRAQPITLVCKSGRRAQSAQRMLHAKGFSAVTVLPGGMDAWRSAGNPVVVSEGRIPWSMERQVRTAAGSLVLVTLALGFFVSPYALLGTAFIGAGLVFAGMSDTCMMARVLGRMPWNGAARAARV